MTNLQNQDELPLEEAEEEDPQKLYEQELLRAKEEKQAAQDELQVA